MVIYQFLKNKPNQNNNNKQRKNVVMLKSSIGNYEVP